MSHVTVWHLGQGRSHTFTDLTETEALVIAEMAGQSRSYLVADASPDIGPRIPIKHRTSWYTRDLPEES